MVENVGMSHTSSKVLMAIMAEVEGGTAPVNATPLG